LKTKGREAGEGDDPSEVGVNIGLMRFGMEQKKIRVRLGLVLGVKHEEVDVLALAMLPDADGKGLESGSLSIDEDGYICG
jgi:hypothetical protein